MTEQRKFVNAYLSADREHVVLCTRGPVGERVEEKVAAEYASFFRRAAVPQDLLRVLRSDEDVAGMSEEGGYLRVRWRKPRRVGGGTYERDVRREACEMFETAERPLQTFEGDVHPVLRHFVDNGHGIARPRRAYIDLETDSAIPFSRKEEMRIFVAHVVDEDGAEKSFVLDADTDEAEEALLLNLWSYLDKYDQLVAWNGERFDFPVLQARTELRGIDVLVDRWLLLDHLVVFKRMNISASESGDEKASMRLGDVAMSLLGEGKDDFDASKTRQAFDRGHGPCDKEPCPGCGKLHDYSAIECMRIYCQKDVRLLAGIEGKTGYLELFMAVCEACGVFPDTYSVNPTVHVDGFMLRLGKERGVRFKTRRHFENVEKFAGAYVMEPTFKGIAKDVHFGDFSRMYPSIIIAWNMSPETRVGVFDPVTKQVTLHDGSRHPMREGWCRAPRTNVVFDTTREGILPVAVTEMLRQRAHWDKVKASLPPGTAEWKLADRRSTAYKTTGNSFFGVASSPFFREYDPRVGESITQTGVELLTQVIHEAQKKGWHPGYGDTDSCAIAGCSDEEFTDFLGWCNSELFPSTCRSLGCKHVDRIKVSYEKKFARIVFTGKKRYAGAYRTFKGTPALASSKPEIKGLEFKRGDTSRLARWMQEEVVKLLLGDWNPTCTTCGHPRAAHEDGDDQAYNPCACEIKDCGCIGFVGDYAPPSERPEDYRQLVARWQKRVLEDPIEPALVTVSKSIEKRLPPTDAEVRAHVDKERQRAEKKNQGWSDEDAARVEADFRKRKEADPEAYKVRRSPETGKAYALPPHVQIAMQLKDRGEEVHAGTKIDYFVTDGSVSPMKVLHASEYAPEKVDRFYLWENLVWPPTERLLEAAFPTEDWSVFGRVRPKKPRAAPKPRAKKETTCDSVMPGEGQGGASASAPAAVPRVRRRAVAAGGSGAATSTVTPGPQSVASPAPTASPAAPGEPTARRRAVVANIVAEAQQAGDGAVAIELPVGASFPSERKSRIPAEVEMDRAFEAAVARDDAKEFRAVPAKVAREEFHIAATDDPRSFCERVWEEMDDGDPFTITVSHASGRRARFVVAAS